jgi:DNA polymerase-1
VGKLVLIDGNAILHRAYHALPPLTNRRGEQINAIYGFVSILLKVITDLDPTYLVVAFDEDEPTFRHKEFAGYQAKRPEKDPELSSQIGMTRKVVKAFGIPLYAKPGYEADDLIGTIADIVVKNKKIDEVIIMTGDKDILQLVNDKVKVFMPAKGLSDAIMMGKAEVKDKMGVDPELIPDYKALVGDPSDNYPGVPGIGPKGAVTLLNSYGSIKGIYENLKNIPKQTSEKLDKGKDSAYLCHRLATIVKDVPIEFEINECASWDIDSPAVLEVFSEIGFRALTERVKKLGQELDSKKQLTLL